MSFEPSYASQPASAAPPAAPQNFFSRLIGVYFSPGETFQEIGRAPRVLVPLLIMMVIGALVGYLMIERIGVQNFFKKQYEQAVMAGQMTQEQADQALERVSSGAIAAVTKYSFPIGGAVQGVIAALFVAGLFKLFSMLMGAENDFKPVLSVTLYAMLAVSLISSTLFIILLFLKSPEEIDIQNLVGSNLRALLSLVVGENGLPKFIMALARWVDLFAIWIITLLAIGYAAVSRRLKTSTAAWMLGSIYAVIALIGATITSLRG
jgi:hypothetical protein